MKVHKEGTGLLLTLFTILFIVNITLYHTVGKGMLFYSVAFVSTVLFLLVLNFFRSPFRRFPYDSEGLVIAPADGTIVAIEEVMENEILHKKCLQISIFMSIFNVHANWFPVNGTVKHVSHQNGRFMAAYLPKSSTENERSAVVITTRNGVDVLARQIAGAMARRIVTYAKPGEKCHVDEQMGFIKFGSRVDVYLPVGTEVLIEMDQKVTGNQTRIRKHIPNTITCLSLLSGCVASVMALHGNLLSALIWIIIAAVFDFCDGFAARLLKAYSPMGKELDSLSDMVSFGFAPGMVVYWLLGEASTALPFGSLNTYIPYLAFVIPTFSGLRLAKFNIDERQTTSFIGLPVPAHALFWASAGYSVLPVVHANEGLFVLVTVILAFITSLLLVSEIPMFSLKVKSLAWKGNELRYILIACAIIFVALWGFLGISGTILLYIVLSIFNKKG